MEPETWAVFLMHLLRWADARVVATAEVEPPEAVKGRLEEQVRYPHSNGPLRLTLPQVGRLAAGRAPGGAATGRGRPPGAVWSTANGARLHGERLLEGFWTGGRKARPGTRKDGKQCPEMRSESGAPPGAGPAV